MPAFLKPGKVFKVSFPGDDHIPVADRPKVLVKAISSSERLDILDEVTALEDDTTITEREREQRRDDLIKRLATGVENCGDVTTVDALLPRLTVIEKTALFYRTIGGNYISEDDAKN